MNWIKFNDCLLCCETGARFEREHKYLLIHFVIENYKYRATEFFADKESFNARWEELEKLLLKEQTTCIKK